MSASGVIWVVEWWDGSEWTSAERTHRTREEARIRAKWADVSIKTRIRQYTRVEPKRRKGR